MNTVAVTADGRLAVSASEDGTLKVWDLAAGAHLRTLRGHTDRVNAVAVTADGRQALSASDDGTLKAVGPGSAVRSCAPSAAIPAGCSPWR